MAGLYIIVGGAPRERIDSAADRLKFFDEKCEIACEPDFAFAWVGHDDPLLFGPAIDPTTGVRVITSGRVAWDEKDWKCGESLVSYKGGVSNRLLLDAYLEGGLAALERHNGAAAVVVWDPREKCVHLFSDHFGYHPIFLYRPEQVKGTVISTFADAIAEDAETQISSDAVSTAELLSACRITPPHTYYREIKYVGAATVSTWNLSRNTYFKRTYWAPFKEEPFPDLMSAVEELTAVTREAVRIRTLPRLCPTVIFVSGGMDSRAIIFSAACQDGAIGFNLYDRPNNEASISRQLCEAAGVKYQGFQRDQDYYPNWHSESARISGAMISTKDSHYLGVRDEVVGLQAATVMSGCTTDWLFKGTGLDKTYHRLFGRNLPLQRFKDKRTDAFLPNLPLPVGAAYARQLEERKAKVFEGTPKHFSTDRHHLLVEDRRIRPICYAPSISGQIMYRIFSYDTFLADRGVADCYSRIKAEWKLNAEVWGASVQKICLGANSIIDANYGWKVGSSKLAKLYCFAKGWIKRRLVNPPAKRLELATEGSWPNLGWYVLNSPTIADIWRSVPEPDKRLIASLMAEDPWNTPLPQWSARPNYFFRILTVAAHLQKLHKDVE